MIFDSLKRKIGQIAGHRPMDDEERGMKEILDKHPALKYGNQESATNPMKLPELEKEYEMKITPEVDAHPRMGERGSGTRSVEDHQREVGIMPSADREFMERLGMNEGLPPLRSELLKESQTKDRSRVLPPNEELEMVMKQLDMIRSQNELILQKLRMIERRLGV